MGINLPDYISVGSRGKFTYSVPTSADDTTPPDKPTFIEIVDN